MTDYPRSVEPGGAGTSPSVAARQGTSRGSGMRSSRGLLGSLLLLVQAASSLVGNAWFSYFANEVLGFWPEKILLSLITFWLIGVLLTASRGRTRILGFVAMAIVVCVEAYVYFGLLYLGTNPFLETAAVKLAYLLPFVWLIFESSKRRARTDP